MSPYAPKTPCRHPGCPALVTKADRGRCAAHRKDYNRAIDRDREPSSVRGYDARWARFRAQYLRAHPICACGCGDPAQEVHHIVPVTGPDDPLFYDESNLAGLTHACHSRETMRMLNDRRKGA